MRCKSFATLTVWDFDQPTGTLGPGIHYLTGYPSLPRYFPLFARLPSLLSRTNVSLSFIPISISNHKIKSSGLEDNSIRGLYKKVLPWLAPQIGSTLKVKTGPWRTSLRRLLATTNHLTKPGLKAFWWRPLIGYTYLSHQNWLERSSRDIEIYGRSTQELGCVSASYSYPTPFAFQFSIAARAGSIPTFLIASLCGRR